MTQMIARYHVADYDRFRTQFDNDAEDRGQNGLSLLQLWRESGSQAWALYQIADAAKAKAYLDGAAGVFNSQAGVLSTEYHFLETA
ncbi:MAG TPA: hypothetical protein VNQ78_04425 [Paracoccus sp. (in: a-proteobacteria)]|uniref:hypothetical protein n=1 Tax=Paracoccus sp. TaxID=267 RepID=UPI002C1CD9C8|nr:hypothetical protein [Paracoccus sp. (in: a-proteobacteria)]HWL55905.1 hypothetical protein [Paracoccus sp. (in: a-proteobacteria)]